MIFKVESFSIAIVFEYLATSQEDNHQSRPETPINKRETLAIFPKTGSLMMFKKVIPLPIIVEKREKVSKKLYIGAFFLLLNLMIQK